MTYDITHIVQREGAYEYWADIFDDEKDLLISNYILQTGSASPLSDVELANIFKSVVFPAFQEEEIPPERVWTADEVTAILRDKGYIGEDVEFSEDMPISLDVG